MAKVMTDLAAFEARYVEKLQARKGALASELAEIDAKLEALGAKAPKAKAAKPGKKLVRKRGGRRGKPLRAYIEEVLAQATAPMAPRDIEQGVRAAGYMSAAKDLSARICTSLRAISGVEKIGRAQYVTKASKPASKGKAKKAKA